MASMPVYAHLAGGKQTKLVRCTSHHEAKIDDICERIRTNIQSKTGYAEGHVLSRTLQNAVKAIANGAPTTDIPIGINELAKTLVMMNIDASPKEVEGVWARFVPVQPTEDARNGKFHEETIHNARLSLKQFADGLFAVGPAAESKFASSDINAVCRKIQEQLLARARSGEASGRNEVRNLTRSLSLMDKDGSNSLSKEELFNGLQKFGIRVTIQDADILLKHLDRDRNGSVSITEFLRGIRGHMPLQRRELVKQAMSILDENNNGIISFEEVAKRYSAARHPAVLSGDKTERDVIQDFMATWDKSNDAQITAQEFFDYYADLSASIDHDDYFELMMRNAWHMSGGSGQAQNTSCRRVLLTFKDGSQRIEEITNDIGISADDKDKMLLNLEARGITGVTKIELYA